MQCSEVEQILVVISKMQVVQLTRP